jgi:hypothetical protein
MSGPDSEIDAREPPIFWVGAAGFSPEQRELIEASLSQTAGLTDWRLCHFGEADAWLVNGAKCRVLPDGNIRVSPGPSSETFLDLDIRAADRPVAFALPIADTSLEPHCTFSVNSFTSVHAMLSKFEACLAFAHAQFVLGTEIVERGAALRHGVFHVSYRNKLLAVLDFWHGEVGLAPQLDPVEVDLAVWSKRPIGARGIPPGFVASTPAQLAWNYARRCEANLLPLRYLTRTIYYRRTPRVPVSWLGDSHLAILKELSQRSGTLSELAARVGSATLALERDLTCLFFAGAITTTESKAASLATAPGLTPARQPVLAEHAAAHHRERYDPTIPGRLNGRPRA